MIEKNRIQSISFLVLLALMLLLMGKLFLPYMSVILWSSVTYILISPLHGFLVKKIKKEGKWADALRRLLAIIFALGTVLIMAGVAFFLGAKLIGQLKVFLEEAKRFSVENANFFVETEKGQKIAHYIFEMSVGTIDLAKIDIRKEIVSFISSYTLNIMAFTTGLLKNITDFIIALIFMSFTLFFFYMDAKYLADVFVRAIPIDVNNTRTLVQKFSEVVKNLFMGFFLVAFYQSFAAFIIFSSFGIKGSLLFSVLIMFSSFVPIVGCALVWFPLGISVLLTKGIVLGILFLCLSAFFISFVDNFLRPLFLKERIKIHPLLIFFSIIGGLELFGLNGILLGPLVIILFFTILDIAMEVE